MCHCSHPDRSPTPCVILNEIRQQTDVVKDPFVAFILFPEYYKNEKTAKGSFAPTQDDTGKKAQRDPSFCWCYVQDDTF
jgi:hypothetical protein